MPSGRVFAGNKGKLTVTGDFSVTGGSVTQYVQGTTAGASTHVGIVVLGINATTAQPVKLGSDGTVFVSGGGGGVQYSRGDTSFAATGTGTMMIGVQSGGTTGRGVLLTTTGSPIITVDGTPTVTVSTGSVSIVGGPTFYVPGAAIASGTGLGGPLFIGVQSGATLGRGVMLTTTGHQFVDTVRLLSTGTVTISGTSTVVFGAAQPISGSVSVINTPTVTIGGTASALLIAGTAGVGGVRVIAHQSRFQALVVATTSAAGGVIIQTSGAHTLYITDYLVSVDGPMQVDLCSETTAMTTMYLATKGGAVSNQVNPIVCTSAHSFRVVCGSSGKCAVSCVGYTVT